MRGVGRQRTEASDEKTRRFSPHSLDGVESLQTFGGSTGGVGASPAGFANFGYALLAQWIERLASNRSDAGLSPAGNTNLYGGHGVIRSITPCEGVGVRCKSDWPPHF